MVITRTTGTPVSSGEWSIGPQWVLGPERERLGPVLNAAGAAWAELELISVSEGVRPSAIVDLGPGDWVLAHRSARRRGLVLTPLHQNGATTVRAAVSRPELVDAWVEARGDDRAVGRLLGYPACCRAHFERTWALGRTETFPDTAGGDWELNLGLRWLGIRAVPHLPCSGVCSESLGLARAILRAGQASGVDTAPLEASLRLPLRYSRTSGVGIVDAGSFRVLVGAEEPPPSCLDNGFSEPGSMEAAHATVAAVVHRATVTSALDLGCGDGALLARLAGGRPGRWIGVEFEVARARRGRARHPEVEMLCGRIEGLNWARWVEDPVDVVLLMPGRLVEMPAAKAAEVRAAVRRVGRRLVVYTYGDWGGLEDLCGKAGLVLQGPVTTVGATSAAEAEVI